MKQLPEDLYQKLNAESVELFRYDELLEVMEYCRASNIPVLGADGFELVGDNVKPLLDIIADFSSLDRSNLEHATVESLKSLSDFLETIPDRENLLWDLVIFDE